MAKLTEAYLKNLIKKVMKESMEESPRDKLRRYLASHNADVRAVFARLERVLSRAKESGEMPTSEDITLFVDHAALGEADDSLHGMLDAVLADEIDLTAYADAEADRKDVKATQRGLMTESRKASGGGYKR